MADTIVTGAVASTLGFTNSLWGPYWSNESTAVIVYLDNGSDPSFARTVDGGVNWSISELEATTSLGIVAFYDKEIPGDAGTLVHVVWFDGTGGDDNLKYNTIDVSDGSVGTERIIQTGLTVNTTPQNNKIALTKTLSNNLIVAYSTQTEKGAEKSVNAGVDWGVIADPIESATSEDLLLLFPANTGDDNDAVLIFWDRSANEISIKMYDDSEDDWTETPISGSMVDDINWMNMDGTVRHSDNHILFAAHSRMDYIEDDLMAWDLTVDDIDSPTVTAKTNIFTGQDASLQVGIIINQQNDDVFVGYIKGVAPSTNDADVVFHKSEDGMGSWGDEQAYSEANDDLNHVHSGRTITNAGGRVQFSFYNDDATDISVNLVHDIEISEFTPPEGVNHQIISGDGLSWFTTEYFGCWFITLPFILFTIIEIIKHLG